MRDGVEGPDELPAEDVEGAQVAGSGAEAFTRCGPYDDQVFENASGCAVLIAAGARDAFARVDAPVLTEGRDRDAGAGVDLLGVAARREDQATIGAVFVFPV